MSGHRAASLRFAVRRAGALLDVLAEASGGSRRGAKRWLDARCVFVNGRRIWMARHPLRLGDRVDVMPVNRPPDDVSLRVVYDDGASLVVDKPAGLVTTGHAGVEARLRVQRKNPALMAVHRLDRDTTGCVLVAYSEAVRRAAVALFREGKVGKIYEAIVQGRVSAQERVIRTPIEKKRAVTEVTLCKAGPEASHVRIRIHTGRTHQIRRHLAEIGHPVLGDRAYGTARPLLPAWRAVPRPLLHAVRLTLPRPDADGTIDVHAPLPEDFRTWLEKLGLGRKSR